MKTTERRSRRGPASSGCPWTRQGRGEGAAGSGDEQDGQGQDQPVGDVLGRGDDPVLRSPALWRGKQPCRIFFKFVSRSWGGSQRREPLVRRGLTAHRSVSEEGLGRCRPAAAGCRIGKAWSPWGSGQRPGHPRSPLVANCRPNSTLNRPESAPAPAFSPRSFLNDDRLDAFGIQPVGD